MKATFNDRAYGSFTANVSGALVGKWDLVCEIVPGTNKIQLYSATAGTPPLGVLFQNLEGSDAWAVRKIGAAASVRMIASGAIPSGAQVKPVAGGTIVKANSGDNAIGVSIDGLAHAAGDVLEVADSYMAVAY